MANPPPPAGRAAYQGYALGNAIAGVEAAETAMIESVWRL